MASIKFTDMVKVGTTSNPKFTFTDLHLDMVYDIYNRDLVVDYDERAISNSIMNILTTVPGERFLIPEFGCDLLSLVFKPITDYTGKMIGQRIFNAIKRWEPRVQIEKILVVGKPDVHEYNISISILLPKLKVRANIINVLGKEGIRESRVI